MARLRAQEERMAREAAMSMSTGGRILEDRMGNGLGSDVDDAKTKKDKKKDKRKEKKDKTSRSDAKGSKKDRATSSSGVVSSPLSSPSNAIVTLSNPRRADAGSSASAPAAAEVSVRKRIVIEVAATPENEAAAEAARRSLAAFVPTPVEGWWGASLFRSAGRLGDAAAKRRERGFDEALQEKVFADAHAGKTQGRVGLGQLTRSLKIEGGNWKGERVTFGDDGEAQGNEKNNKKENNAKEDSAMACPAKEAKDVLQAKETAAKPTAQNAAKQTSEKKKKKEKKEKREKKEKKEKKIKDAASKSESKKAKKAKREA